MSFTDAQRRQIMDVIVSTCLTRPEYRTSDMILWKCGWKPANYHARELYREGKRNLKNQSDLFDLLQSLDIRFSTILSKIFPK